MILVSPFLYSGGNCPACSGKVVWNKLRIPGIHVMGEATCTLCHTEWLLDLPVGHSLHFPVHLKKEDGKIIADKRIRWYSEPLALGWNHPDTSSLIPQYIVHKSYSEIILLNCLDYLYGHVLLKLLNASGYLREQPNKGLIVLIPQGFEWLVPDGVAECWVVPRKLSELKKWNIELENSLLNRLNTYAKVYLGMAYSHPNFEEIKIQEYTRVKPFDLSAYFDLPLHLCFIWREDRLWLGNSWQERIHHYSRILKLKWIEKIGIIYSRSRYIKCIKKLQKNIPGIKITIIGLGKKDLFPKDVEDLCQLSLDPHTEKKWCEIYAQSHLVIGIHGSNMLLPTAHSAGFVELLPSDRQGNMTQDIASTLQGKTAWYLGRFVEATLSPQKLANIITEMLHHYPHFESTSRNDTQVWKEIKSVIPKSRGAYPDTEYIFDEISSVSLSENQ